MLEFQCQIATQTMIMYFPRRSFSMKYRSNVMRIGRWHVWYVINRKRFLGTIWRRWRSTKQMRRSWKGQRRWRRSTVEGDVHRHRDDWPAENVLVPPQLQQEEPRESLYCFSSKRVSPTGSTRGSKSFFRRRSLTEYFLNDSIPHECAQCGNTRTPWHLGS